MKQLNNSVITDIMADAPPEIRAIAHRMRPHVWMPEFVRGCNLKCWHCPVSIFPKGTLEFMSFDTWEKFVEIIRAVNPTGHIQLANNGEPTMHPEFSRFISYARSQLPGIQIECYTNGLYLIAGKITYEEMFESGVNSIFVDMYHKLERHEALVKASGYPYSVEDDKKRVHGIFSHKGDKNYRHVLLARNPSEWPQKRINQHRLGSWLNNLDWAAIAKRKNNHNLTPVKPGEAPARRCDQPTRSCVINIDGTYTICCQDFMQEGKGKFGSIETGVKGFYEFFLGEYMQNTRRELYRKNRNGLDFCSRCKWISGRADISLWPEEGYDWYITKARKRLPWVKLDG